MKSLIGRNKNRSTRKVYTSKEIFASVILVGTLLYIERYNILYCGSVPNETTVTQLQEFIHGLTDEEADVFARQIQFIPNQGWIPQHDPEVIRTNRIRWESVTIFILATTALFIAARYGQIIREVLFNISLPSAQDIYAGMAEAMNNLGRATIFRQELAAQAAHLLNDPETEQRVQTAIQAVRTMRL